MAKEITNTAASVHARFLKQARAGLRAFNGMLHLYAMARVRDEAAPPDSILRAAIAADIGRS